MTEPTPAPADSVATAAAPTIRPGACGACTLCCKVLAVNSIAKPANTWCSHCKTGVGCGIYATRPGECANFICGFLSMTQLGEEWRPMHSKLIIDLQTSEGSMHVYVDPSRPNAWRQQPYYAALQGWSRRALARNGRVTVRIGSQSIVVLPDHAVDLGTVAKDEVIVVLSSWVKHGGNGSHEVFAAKTEAWKTLSPAVLQGKVVPSLAEGFRPGRRLD